MPNVSIDVKGLEQLVDKLGLGSIPIIRALTRGVAEEVRAEIAQYPGPVKLPFKWASRKQRTFVLAQRRGMGPYVRNSDPFSQRLGPSWATEHRGEHDAAVGTRVTYAPYVQEKGKQQPGHAATGWVTDEEAGRKVERSGVAERLLEDITSKW
jgi:hypothetical protein